MPEALAAFYEANFKSEGSLARLTIWAAAQAADKESPFYKDNNKAAGEKKRSVKK